MVQERSRVTRAWSEDVLAHVRPGASPRFADHLRARAAGDDFPHPPWSVAALPEERGLEAWVGWLALYDRPAYVTAAAAAARHVYPIVIARAGEEAMSCGLHENAPCTDGASEGQKLLRVEAWLAAPSAATTAAVEEAIDHTRQVQIWDEDLAPPEEQMWWWFMAVGELTARAAVHDEDGAIGRPNDPHTWSAPVCAARAAVCALRAMRSPGGDIAADVSAIGRAIAAAFE